jgi:hypothetical protein
MKLQQTTLEQLRNLINEETEYRSGPKLVEFFNQLGFVDQYCQGFPSRWIYTDEKLKAINGTPELDKCIKMVFSPIRFVDRINDLDSLIAEFNKYLSFDKWMVRRDNDQIIICKNENGPDLNSNKKIEQTEDAFLKTQYEEIDFNGLGLDGCLINILNSRIDEINKCIKYGAPLSGIFLCGSILEGCLLGLASKNPQSFNMAKAAPKDKEGKNKSFPNWSLSSFIDAAYEIGYLKEDVKKFSHSLRDFRNYIHPYQQMSENFTPDEHTLSISWQVLKAAIHQLKRRN